MALIDLKDPMFNDVKEQVSHEVLTVPNVISFIRLCLIPVFVVLLFSGNDIAACLVFSITAATDFVDGFIARETGQVSRLGQFLDPFVDRVLVITVILSLMIVGRLPIWVVLLVLIRDLYLIWGGWFLLTRYKVRVAVLFLGKVATTFMFVGCAALLLNIPQIPGLGWCDFAWLPGFNSDPCGWGIWVIYVGMALVLFTTAYYTLRAFEGRAMALTMKAAEEAAAEGNAPITEENVENSTTIGAEYMDAPVITRESGVE